MCYSPHFPKSRHSLSLTTVLSRIFLTDISPPPEYSPPWDSIPFAPVSFFIPASCQQDPCRPPNPLCKHFLRSSFQPLECVGFLNRLEVPPPSLCLLHRPFHHFPKTNAFSSPSFSFVLLQRTPTLNLQLDNSFQSSSLPLSA